MKKQITLKGTPPSTSHIYKYRSAGKFIMGYMSKEGKDIKKQYIQEMTEQWDDGVLDENLSVTVKYFWGDKRVRDIDNFSKLIFDAGTGIIWKDDSQIKELVLSMDYCKENPRVCMFINKL